tara:strand:+ start:429 stop:767 length:339 start_codon:yes stop_codon:yes gene_type:complete
MVSTAEELAALVQAENARILLQFGKPGCTRCLPFSATAEELQRAYGFVRAYVNTIESPELVEQFEVCKLPAFSLLEPGAKDWLPIPLARQPASLDDLRAAVAPSQFTLDEDF